MAEHEKGRHISRCTPSCCCGVRMTWLNSVLHHHKSRHVLRASKLGRMKLKIRIPQFSAIGFGCYIVALLVFWFAENGGFFIDSKGSLQWAEKMSGHVQKLLGWLQRCPKTIWLLTSSIPTSPDNWSFNQFVIILQPQLLPRNSHFQCFITQGDKKQKNWLR